MPKRLVICCDGTWDVPDHLDRGLVRPTNVAKLALAVSQVAGDGTEQQVYYHAGVGTGRFDHLRGGIFGSGLSRNILDAYRFIIGAFEENDELWLFGFSRGAYTARSLAGLIRNCGVLQKERASKLSDAYALYRRRDDASHPAQYESVLFRKMYSVMLEPLVKCIGVWDTVGALGIPYGIPALPAGLVKFAHQDLAFHDVQLSSHIENAFQALAIDERRPQFRPTLWEQQAVANQRLHQVWFAGAHSNVGGSYADTGLSDLALQWMMERVESAGLSLAVDQSLSSMAPNCRGELRNSKVGLFALFKDDLRSIGQPRFAKQFAHQSAVDRMRDAPDLDYHPDNLINFLDGGGAVTP